MQDPLEIVPAEVKRKIDSGGAVRLLDVREPDEFSRARIEGAVLIPMGSVPARLGEVETLAEEGELIVYCHHGVRSLRVAAWLREQGVSSKSMSGGIDRWSADVDSSVPRY